MREIVLEIPLEYADGTETPSTNGLGLDSHSDAQ